MLLHFPTSLQRARSVTGDVIHDGYVALQTVGGNWHSGVMEQINTAIKVNGFILTREASSSLSGSARFKAAEALSRFAEAEKFRAAAMLHDEAQQAIDPRIEALQSHPGMKISLRTGRMVSGAATDSAAMEIALICGLSQGQAHRVLDQAETLVMDTPEVLESLALGRIGAGHVQRILEHTQHILPQPVAMPGPGADEAVREQFERDVAELAAQSRVDRRDFGADMLAIAPGKSPSQLRSRGRQVLEKYYGFSFTRRSRTELRDRRICLEEARDGMTWFTGYLPTARCQAIFAKVDAMARLLKADPESAAAVARAAASPGSTATAETCTAAGLDSPTGEPDSDPGESRTMDQLRADVFTDMLLNGPRGQGLETVQAEVFVTIPATMLPGTPGGPSTLDETPTDGFDSGGPSEAGGRARPGSSGTSGIDLPGALGRVTLTPGGPVPSILGGGPIDQDSAAQLMVAAKTWWRVITDPVTGAIVEFGQGRYRPTAAQKAILRFRDGSCTTPGCTGPGRSCEIDHTREWQDGGATDISNLRLGCKRCHRLKSLGLIEVEQRAGGTILVTSLFGTRRVGYPAAPWAVADPQQATAATGTDTGGDAPDDSIPGTAPPADQDSLIPKVEPASYHPVRPGEETAEKPCDAAEKAEPVDDQEQSLPDRDWGQVQDVPDSSSASPVHGRYAKTTQAKAARKRRLKRNAGEYGPSTIPRPDDRDNPLRPRQEPPQPPPEPPF